MPDIVMEFCKGILLVASCIAVYCIYLGYKLSKED